jgi:hypothetical protein
MLQPPDVSVFAPLKRALGDDPASGKLELSPGRGGGRTPAMVLTQITSSIVSLSFVFPKKSHCLFVCLIDLIRLFTEAV